MGEIIKYSILLTVCLCNYINIVYGQSEIKSSLAFVIDTTGSMNDDIDAVKKQANAIFDAVANSNKSQVEDFILVEFNDPYVNFRTQTTNREDFKYVLNYLNVNGGGDCPEMSLSGIEMALDYAKRGSDLYVFTDAYAKDENKYETVKDLAISKGCRIIFFISESSCILYEGFSEVYDKLAEVTEGQVFDLKKDEVHEVLKYVLENVKSRKTLIASENFPAGNHKHMFTVDSNMKELIVSVNGYNLEIEVTDGVGDIVKTEEIVKTKKNTIVKVSETKPGIYTADISSDLSGTIKVYVTNTLHFEHGFSRLLPTAIHETTFRPYPDEESYLSVKVNVEGGAIKLFSIALYDLKDKLILEKSLDEVNIDDQFYCTREAFRPPNQPFRIAIKAFDLETNEIITRFGIIPIEPQEWIIDVIENRAPNVTVVGATEVHVEFEQPAELKCRISGYPKPKVTWEDENGKGIASKETQIEIPYDYVSVIKIENVDKNKTVACKASNILGEDKKTIELRTRRTRYFNVIETPKDAHIQYHRRAQFVCKVDAAPQKAHIEWFRENRKLKTNRKYKISSDGTVLTVKSMKPDIDGNFKCIARNNLNKKSFKFTVTTTGIEKPSIEKRSNEIHVRRGSSTTIECNIVKGLPRPTIKWHFQPAYSRAKVVSIKGGEKLVIEKVSERDAGTYRCEANNAAGIDYHYIDLIVEYKPVIRDTKKVVRANDGEQVRLPCVAFGEPQPEVTWYFNGRPVNDKSFHHLGNHILSFKAKTNLTGEYRCEASNTLGVTSGVTISVYIVVPVYIVKPEKSTYVMAVGQDLRLDCQAYGDPTPRVEWLYQPLYSTDPPQPLTFESSLMLKRIQVDQEGYYTCTARNTGSSANFTYTVNILAPPTIVSENPDNVFKAVVGDLVLRLPCKTTGSPSPIITWEKDGYNIASGTDWYDIEKDGTLIIKNIVMGAEGFYTCHARNSMGADMKTFEVVLENTPKAPDASNTLFTEEGKTVDIPCPIPHKRADLLRWYKDGKQIKIGELTIKNIAPSDNGHFTCRVSNFINSSTGAISVQVGFKPKFLYDVKTDLEFIDGSYVDLDCSVQAKPDAEITWWDATKNLKSTSMRYSFKMTHLNKGRYLCLVKNQFGSIVREFNIASKQCVLNAKKDFGPYQPIMVPDKGKSAIKEIDGYIHIPQNHTIVLACPSAFEGMNDTKVTAFCHEGMEFIVNGEAYDFFDLKCSEEFVPVVIDTTESCLRGQQIFKIGYESDSDFVEVFEVCYDDYKKIPSYVKYTIEPAFSETDLEDATFYYTDVIPIDFDEMYTCNKQSQWISSLLKRPFDKDCCFARRQMVNARDMVSGLSQLATFSNLNVFPHWSTCNDDKNWEMVEKRIRRLVKESNYPMTVWTGVSGDLQLQGETRKEYITITDNGEIKVRVPQYIWKVIQDPRKKASLAIIKINIPELKQSKVLDHLLCKDICSDVPWMKRSSGWRNVDNGVVYCCSIKDFERNFEMLGVFEPNMETVLR